MKDTATGGFHFRSLSFPARWFFRICLVALLLLHHPFLSAQNRKIAVFGSSVANGAGDTTGTGGYAGWLSRLLSSGNWQVVNLSKGGDNTSKIMPRFESQLIPAGAKYVIIGLSLGNEGIVTTNALDRERIFEKYRSGLFQLLRQCRQYGMVPVVAGCYARSDFEEPQYDAVKKMNLIINSWDVPSINFMGTIDDGKGRWLEGYVHDRAHPNEKGHREMYYAIVPTLFDALEAGKQTPFRVRGNACLNVRKSAHGSPLTFTSADTIHSFSISFLSRTSSQGTLAAVNPGKSGIIVNFDKGKILCLSPSGITLSADTTSENKGWQYIVITHQYASGKTTFYVNGISAGCCTEHIDFRSFVLGGSGISNGFSSPEEVAYRDLLIYRSALNHEEVTALYHNQLLQSSLEIYAPLNDPEFIPGKEALNLAQSLSTLIIGQGLLFHADK